MPKLAICIATVALVAVAGACSTGGGSAPTATAPAANVSQACASAWAAAAAVDEMHDSVKDLFPAVRACTIEEWRTEFAAYNGLRFIGNADGVLSNMCFSAEIEQTALCRAVQPSDAPVPTTTTANARLGTRATVLDYFDSLGFDGELSTLVTGEERWMGSNDDFSAEVIGPAGAVRQISVFMDLTPANEDDSRKFISQTLAEFVPGSADWAAQELSGAIRGTDSQREFGPVTVKLSGSVADTFTLVFVTMTHR